MYALKSELSDFFELPVNDKGYTIKNKIIIRL